jgi:hypothetical protein
MDVALLDRDLGAERLEPADVQVDRARADRAAAGQRHQGLAEARHQRAQDQDRGAHGLDQVVGRDVAPRRPRIDQDAHALVHHQLHAHLAQQFHRGGDVVQVRHVADLDRLVGQQRGGQDRQHGILGAGDPDLAIERLAAADHDLGHRYTSRARGSGAARRFLGRHRPEAQRVDRAAHEVAQRCIDHPVPGQRQLALELLRHHFGLEMHAVGALDGGARTRQALLDQALDGGGVHGRSVFTVR